MPFYIDVMYRSVDRTINKFSLKNFRGVKLIMGKSCWGDEGAGSGKVNSGKEVEMAGMG